MAVKRIFFLLLLLLVPLALAAPPTLVESAATAGLEVKTFLTTTHKQSEKVSFHAHVYNATSGLPMKNETIGCDLHLYNQTGSHLAELYQRKVAHNYDFEFTLMGGNFSTLGEYNVNINCNNSVVGGYIEEVFEVTPSGQINSDYSGLNNIATIIALFALSIIFLYFSFNLKPEHFLLKLFLLFFSLFPLMLLGKVIHNGYSETVTSLIGIPVWFFRIFVAYFSVYLFYYWTKKSEVLTKWFGKR